MALVRVGGRPGRNQTVDVVVAEAGVEEVELLEPLWRSMVEHHRALVGREWPVRDAGEAWVLRRIQYLEWLHDGTATLFTAAVRPSTELVGYAMLRIAPAGPTWELGPETGEVESLAVLESARGGGVGSALLSACREALRERGVEYWSVAVVEANRAATRLYEREGFRPFYRHLLGRLDPGA
jgi:ribosomal protein S18 acetylase RimI-like enzyme